MSGRRLETRCLRGQEMCELYVVWPGLGVYDKVANRGTRSENLVGAEVESLS